MQHQVTDEVLFNRLAEVTSYILNQPELLAEWTRDWWPFTAKSDVEEDDLPAFAVMPDTASEVAAILGVAASTGREVVVKGGGTNLVGALESRPGAILIDLRGLNVIGAVNETDHTVCVDAGVHGGELEERLNEQGFTLGHFPGSLNLSTIGGWLSTRSVGAFATRYGGIENMVQGFEVVLPDGTLLVNQAIPLQLAGPDWSGCFLGSEGAFGIVTAVTLRVRPIPEVRRFRAFSLPSLESGFEALRKLVQMGVVPSAVALHDAQETGSVAFDLGTFDATNLLILGFDGLTEMVEIEERIAGQLLSAFDSVDLGPQPGDLWFERLYRSDWLLDGNESDGAFADEIDVTTPWSTLHAVIEAGREALLQHATEVRIHSTAIYPTGAMIGFKFFIQKERDDAALLAYQLAWRDCMDAVLAAGGSIAHRNGVGQVRLPWFAQQQSEAMRILRGLKHALDPDRRLNRGRLEL